MAVHLKSVICNLRLAALAAFILSGTELSAETYLDTFGAAGEHGSYWVNYDQNPKVRTPKFSDTELASYYSTTCFVKPGETPRVKINVSVKRDIIKRFGDKACEYIVTVEGGSYEGKKSQGVTVDSRTSNWKVPVKQGWNKVVINTDVYNGFYEGFTKLGTLSQEVSFFVFVVEIEKTGQLRSPFSGYPEVNIANRAVVANDGTIFACLACFTRPRGGGGIKYALVHMEPGGRIIKQYEINDEMETYPMAYDSDGGLYVWTMERIVRFNSDGSFDRPIVSFDYDYDEEITARHLKDKVYPTTVQGKKTLTPCYPQLHHKASCPETVSNGKFVYLMVEQHREVNGKHDDVPGLCRLDLESGRIDVLCDIKVNDGPILGPKGLMYMRAPTSTNGPKSPRGFSICDVLGFDANGRQAASFSLSDGGYRLNGFDGAGCVYNGKIMSPDGRMASSDLNSGRLRYMPLGYKTRYLDLMGGQETFENTLMASGGVWMYGGSYYCLYREDGYIAKFTSQSPGTANVPKPVPAVVKLGKKGLFSGWSSEDKAKPGQSGKPADKTSQPVKPEDLPAPTDNSAEQIPSSIGEDWTPDQPANPNEDSTQDSPVTPGEAAGATAAAGIVAAIGSFLFSRAMGVNISDFKDSWNILSGSGGNQPVPPPMPPPEQHYDGEVNANGEVWSENGGWCSRADYERDLATRRLIADASRMRYDDNVYIRDARAEYIKAKNDHMLSQINLVEATAGLMSVNLEQLQGRESGSRYYTKSRDDFFRTLMDQAIQSMKGKDLDQMVTDLDGINAIIERQGRPTFEPTKTTRDKVEDGLMRGIAVTADMALTKGGMSALVSGFQTARDGILTGMSEGEALTRGTIQGAVEGATAGIGHLAGKMGINQAIVMAGTNAAIGTATSLRDGLAQGKTLLSAAMRAVGDGAFAGSTSYVTDKVSDIALVKAKPYINSAKTFARTHVQPYVDKAKPFLQVPTGLRPKTPDMDINPDVAGKLNAVRGNIAKGPNGENVLPIEDAKTLMRDSRTGRVMKPNPKEFTDVTDAHTNTVNNIKSAHDAKTADDFLKENPLTPAQQTKGAVRKEVKIEDFNTPGQKSGRSVDRDQRMMETLYDKDGNIISRREVPRYKWEGHSQKNFAEVTNYSEGDFRKTLSPGEQNAFDGMDHNQKLKLYQEKHGWKCTDKFHTEASIDNSDQIIDPNTGKVTTVKEPNIVRVKRGEGTLKDAQGEGLMYQDKVRDAVGSEQPVEGFAQAKKAVTTYDEVRTGLESQRLDVGKIKPHMRETMDIVNQNADAAAKGNTDAANRINMALKKNGFKNLNDFADKLGGHIESLKWAKPKGGETCGGAFYSDITGKE